MEGAEKFVISQNSGEFSRHVKSEILAPQQKRAHMLACMRDNARQEGDESLKPDDLLIRPGSSRSRDGCECQGFSLSRSFFFLSQKKAAKKQN